MRNYKRKTERIVCTPGMLEAAKQRLAGGESKSSIARSFGLTEAALRQRLKKGYGAGKLGRFRTIFTEEQEMELAEQCKILDTCFYGLTFMCLRRAVYQYAEANKIPTRFNPSTKLAGKDWTLAFMRRHKLSLRTPQQTSLARMMGFNRVQMDVFFRNLTEVMTKYGFSTDRIYNMDESGMSTVPNSVQKVVSECGKKAVGKVSSGERGELVTAVCAMSAQGGFVPPVLIFKRKRTKIELLNGAPPGTMLMVSDTGFINTDLFLEWLEHFRKHTNATKDNLVLLILDNHISHQSLRAIDYCRENGIVLLSIPPHSSHKVQPLDRCFFKSLKANYSVACNNWLVTHPGRVITQYQVAELFGLAYCLSASVEKAVNAFRMCGIVPINPGVFSDADFAPSAVTDIDPNQENITPDKSQSCGSERSENSALMKVARKQEAVAGTGHAAVSTRVAPATGSTSFAAALPQDTVVALGEFVAGNQTAGLHLPDPHAGCRETLRPLMTSLKGWLESFETAYGSLCSASNNPVSYGNVEQVGNSKDQPKRKDAPQLTQHNVQDIVRPKSESAHCGEPECSQRTKQVSFAELNPLPKRKEPQQRRKRGQKSEILTSSPYKRKLEVVQEEKANKQNKSSSSKELFKNKSRSNKKIKTEKD